MWAKGQIQTYRFRLRVRLLNAEQKIDLPSELEIIGLGLQQTFECFEASCNH